MIINILYSKDACSDLYYIEYSESLLKSFLQYVAYRTPEIDSVFPLASTPGSYVYTVCITYAQMVCNIIMLVSYTCNVLPNKKINILKI